MGRQIGAVIGVAVVVSVLGTPHGAQQALDAFRHAWIAIIVAAVLAAATALVLATAQHRACTGGAGPAATGPTTPPAAADATAAVPAGDASR
jgi:hypothetical protein